jgi:hypothetical protein
MVLDYDPVVEIERRWHAFHKPELLRSDLEKLRLPHVRGTWSGIEDFSSILLSLKPTVNAHTVTEELKNWLWLGISSWVRVFVLFLLTHTLVFSEEPSIGRDSGKPQSNALRLSKITSKWFGGNALGKGPGRHTS